MALPTIVQFAQAESGTGVALPLAPTPGNLLVLIQGGTALTGQTQQTGFTVQAVAKNDVGTSFFRRSGSVQTRVVQVGDTTGVVTGTAGAGVYFLYELSGADFDSIVAVDSIGVVTPFHVVAGGAVTPTAGKDVIVFGYSGVRQGNSENLVASSTPDTGWTQDWFTPYLNWNYPSAIIVRKAVTGASGSYTPGSTLTIDGGGSNSSYFGISFAIAGLSGPPVADFTAAPVNLGDTTLFADTSTNAPTSWLWDFGDGNTSTSQNPTHVYAAIGTYSVTLTATNAAGSDSETHSVTVLAAGTPDPPVPAGVLLEIYASAPGSARWDVAKWDEAVWGEAGWRDVTPLGINVDITWGSTSPDDGILTVPSAASWAVDYYDPDRILDPSNEDGPYFGDLIPGLPIRVSHRSTIIRVGNVTGISHSYIKPQSGFMRAADNITVLANAQVPSDTTLSDTLYARAQDAIEAAGLAVQVRPVVGTDPAVSPWVTGTREWSVWEWIKDAAQETLQIPFIDKDGFVGFRPWALPLARGRGVSSPELIGLQVVSDYSGLYSVVQATDATDTVIERALTPPPRYGARVFARTEHTLDAGAWADAVLADRAFPILRWQPGEIYPLTALSVEQHATIEAVERISVSFPEADPAIFVSGIVVGGEISIRGKQGQAAKWRFTFYTAQTINEPLIETGGDPTDYLLRTGGGEYLYPSS